MVGGILLPMLPVIIILCCVYAIGGSGSGDDANSNISCSKDETKPNGFPHDVETNKSAKTEGDKSYQVISADGKTYYLICGAGVSGGGNNGGSGGINVPGPKGLQDWIAWARDPSNWNAPTGEGNGIYFGIDEDGWYGAQCSDLSASWIMAALGLNYYTRVDASCNNGYCNGGEGFPPSGVFRATLPVKAGDIIFFVGHTAVATTDEGDDGSFTILEQNPSSPHFRIVNIIGGGILTNWRINS
jgi:hypothetical protein